MEIDLSKDEVRVIKKLLDYLDDALGDSNCRDDLTLTEAFLRSQTGIDAKRIIAWLKEHGGYCDCEVLANIDELFNS